MCPSGRRCRRALDDDDAAWREGRYQTVEDLLTLAQVFENEARVDEIEADIRERIVHYVVSLHGEARLGRKRRYGESGIVDVRRQDRSTLCRHLVCEPRCDGSRAGANLAVVQPAVTPRLPRRVRVVGSLTSPIAASRRRSASDAPPR